MRKSQIRRFCQGSAFAAAVAIAGATAPSVVSAQVTGDAQTTTTDDDNDGMDLGWLGLLGLAGLLGLRRRDNNTTMNDTTRR